jgi:hypothetical protein
MLWEGKEWQEDHVLERRGIEIGPCSGKERNDNRTTFWEGKEWRQDHSLGKLNA